MSKVVKIFLSLLNFCALIVITSLPPATPAAYAQVDDPQAPGVDNKSYLPQITGPLGPPEFTIISPSDGLSISGVNLFAIQPIDARTVSSVLFQAGSTTLGSDTTAADGYQLFLDASKFTAGALTLTATATGPTGQTTKKSITVTVVPKPPAQASVGASGTTLGTTSGNTIVVPPGSVNARTEVAVQDKSQAQVTAEKGINWDALGVTFLGAIDVTTSGPISKPLGVSSVGFGNRIQPGQAVVTYRILPDADGDGAGELVVVNGANLAPNGTIVSSSVPQITVKTVTSYSRAGATGTLADGLHGPPGTRLTVESNGWNGLSAQGNVAIFRSQVNGETIELPGTVSPGATSSDSQIFTTLIPNLLPGAATLSLINRSTGAVAGPFAVTVETAPAITSPAARTIDDALAAAISGLQRVKALSSGPGLVDIDRAISNTSQLRSQLQSLAGSSNPADQKLLTTLATLIENSDALRYLQNIPTLTASSVQACDINALKDFATGAGLIGGALLAIAALPASVPLLLVGAGAFLVGVGGGIFIGSGIGQCLPPPCAPSPAGSGAGTTGMGGAPPAGGNGCGNASGGGGGFVQSAELDATAAGRYLVKVFPQAGTGAALTPFTGASDPGGYFFVPLIPQGEPFKAVATDRVTGAAVTFSGVGPATGQSVLMSFDFTGAKGNRYPIQVGDTISNGVPSAGAGNIEQPGGVDIYTFNAAAGQQVFFDLFNVAESLVQLNWRLIDPNGEVLFDRIFNCCGGDDPGVYTLRQPGLYTIEVGNDKDPATGTYGFKLWNVPLPNRFAIAVGDTVSNSVPGPGAGNLESPGVKDIYTFNANAGQQVYFDLFNVAENLVQIPWRLTSPNGDMLFDNIFNCCGGNDPGVYTLAQSGLYTITVGSDRDNNFGAYAFKLWPVPAPSRFTIAIGDTVANGSPGPGAGNLESPGVKDIYTFNATAGAQVYFDLFNVQENLTQINWKLTAPNGDVIFDNIFNCCGGNDPGAFTLAQSGIYTLTVGDDRDVNTGTYAFKLWPVAPPNQFSIAVGDTVANDVPGPGAGDLEAPGAKDIYTFNAPAGQQVTFDMLSFSPELGQASWKVTDSTGAVVFDACLACGDPGAKTLTTGGLYTITVVQDRNATSGTYSFQLRTP